MLKLKVLYSINEIDTALQFYHIAGAPIERSTMKHVAKTVAQTKKADVRSKGSNGKLQTDSLQFHKQYDWEVFW